MSYAHCPLPGLLFGRGSCVDTYAHYLLAGLALKRRNSIYTNVWLHVTMLTGAHTCLSMFFLFSEHDVYLLMSCTLLPKAHDVYLLLSCTLVPTLVNVIVDRATDHTKTGRNEHGIDCLGIPADRTRVGMSSATLERATDYSIKAWQAACHLAA